MNLKEKTRFPALSMLLGTLMLALAACDQNTSADKMGNIDQIPDQASRQATSPADGNMAGNQIDKNLHDAMLTAKVRSALDAEPDLRSSALEVDTSDGIVILSGTVNSPGNRNKAVQVAANVEGVKSVDSRLVITIDS